MSSTYDKEALAKAAATAAEQAYEPYSKFSVGAALLTDKGEIITGCNIENASYGLTICAERVAVFKAVSLGLTSFRALAISVPGAGSPCGACRQVLHEFSPGLPIILADDHGIIHQETSLRDLLPQAFGPESIL